MKTRCPWADDHPLLTDYHDREWGVPVHDEVLLFEFLVLQGAQAGLSWLTILKKRSAYRQAYDGFDPARVARYSERKIDQLLANRGIVRNKLKIQASVANAKAFLKVQDEHGSFDTYIWQFVGGTTRQNAWRRMADLPANTRASDTMSKELKKRGFKFVGSTICYALMQSVGMVNDHLIDCFRYGELAGKRRPRRAGGRKS